jgi:hypothetical protein
VQGSYGYWRGEVMQELHFLPDEMKIKRLDTALDRAIDILREDYGCPLGKDIDCQHPSRMEICDTDEDDSHECWRTYLTRWSE